MSHTIRYRRPETPWNLVRMVVPTKAETAAQKARLEALGYTLVDISPPLGCDPTNDPQTKTTGPLSDAVNCAEAMAK